MPVAGSVALRAGAAAVAAAALCVAATGPAGATTATAGTGSAGSVGRVARSSGGTEPQNDVQAEEHASTSLEGCVAADATADGVAKFVAHMTALPGASEMEIRFEILEREPGEASFHRPPEAGTAATGTWRVSGEHVTVFKDFDEVTGLGGPALFRAKVRFRWLDAEGDAIASAEHQTSVCKQPAASAQPGS